MALLSPRASESSAGSFTFRQQMEEERKEKSVPLLPDHLSREMTHTTFYEQSHGPTSMQGILGDVVLAGRNAPSNMALR